MTPVENQGKSTDSAQNCGNTTNIHPNATFWHRQFDVLWPENVNKTFESNVSLLLDCMEPELISGVPAPRSRPVGAPRLAFESPGIMCSSVRAA